MYSIYILFSEVADKFYVGHSQDPWKKLEQHLSNDTSKLEQVYSITHSSTTCNRHRLFELYLNELSSSFSSWFINRFNKTIMEKEQQIIYFLSKAGQFDSDELNDFIRRSKALSIKKGDTLVKEDQYCHSVYFMHSRVISGGKWGNE